MVRAAGALAVTEGLEQVTAKNVAAALGVVPGLVSHYFSSADDLVTEAFVHCVQAERDEIFDEAGDADSPSEHMRRIVRAWLDPARDPISLLWLDAWQAHRRRPRLSEAVAEQMTIDIERLTDIIDKGQAVGEFDTCRPPDAAIQVLALVDGLSVQAATRERIDYAPVQAMAITTIERILGLQSGDLRIGPHS